MNNNFGSNLGEILPGLWIGSLASIRNISSTQSDPCEWTVLSILESEQLIRMSTALVLAARQQNTVNSYHHVVWKLPDKFTGDFLCKKLESILLLIDDHVPAENHSSKNATAKACLVHCAQGISRSAAVCTAWLISRNFDATLQSALERLRKVRPQVQPNMGFVASLRALEQCGGDVESAIERIHKNKKEI